MATAVHRVTSYAATPGTESGGIIGMAFASAGIGDVTGDGSPDVLVLSMSPGWGTMSSITY